MWVSFLKVRFSSCFCVCAGKKAGGGGEELARDGDEEWRKQGRRDRDYSNKSFKIDGQDRATDRQIDG